MHTGRPRFFSLIPLVVLVVACAGEGDTAGGSQTPAAASGAGGPAATTGPGATDAPAGPTLTIEGRAFGQVPQVAAGESFTIINLDSTRHTFTSSDGSWEPVDLSGDSEASFTVPESLPPGSYRFICAIHPDMGGTLTVSG